MPNFTVGSLGQASIFKQNEWMAKNEYTHIIQHREGETVIANKSIHGSRIYIV